MEGVRVEESPVTAAPFVPASRYDRMSGGLRLAELAGQLHFGGSSPGPPQPLDDVSEREADAMSSRNNQSHALSAEVLRRVGGLGIPEREARTAARLAYVSFSLDEPSLLRRGPGSGRGAISALALGKGFLDQRRFPHLHRLVGSYLERKKKRASDELVAAVAPLLRLVKYGLGEGQRLETCSAARERLRRIERVVKLGHPDVYHRVVTGAAASAYMAHEGLLGLVTRRTFIDVKLRRLPKSMLPRFPTGGLCSVSVDLGRHLFARVVPAALELHDGSGAEQAPRRVVIIGGEGGGHATVSELKMAFGTPPTGSVVVSPGAAVAPPDPDTRERLLVVAVVDERFGWGLAGGVIHKAIVLWALQHGVSILFIAAGDGVVLPEKIRSKAATVSEVVRRATAAGCQAW